MFLTTQVQARPMFPQRSRLAVVRDVAVLVLCVGIVLGFLIQIWSAPAPMTSSPPLAGVAWPAMTARG